MTLKAAVCLSFVASCLFAPVGQAQDAPRPGYILVVGKTTDRNKIATYAASLPPIYASLDAYYVAIGGPGRGVKWIEGPWTDRSIILGKFPSRASVDAFWWGPAYRAAIPKRDNAGVFSVVAQEGLGPIPFEGAETGFLIVMSAPSSKPEASKRATEALINGVVRSGGQMVTSAEPFAFTSMEGDTVFDRISIAAWPTKQARDAYLSSRDAKRAKVLRQKAGLSAVASADGVPRNQAPTATPTK